MVNSSTDYTDEHRKEFVKICVICGQHDVEESTNKKTQLRQLLRNCVYGIVVM